LHKTRLYIHHEHENLAFVTKEMHCDAPSSPTLNWNFWGSSCHRIRAGSNFNPKTWFLVIYKLHDRLCRCFDSKCRIRHLAQQTTCAWNL